MQFKTEFFIQWIIHPKQITTVIIYRASRYYHRTTTLTQRGKDRRHKVDCAHMYYTVDNGDILPKQFLLWERYLLLKYRLLAFCHFPFVISIRPFQELQYPLQSPH